MSVFRDISSLIGGKNYIQKMFSLLVLLGVVLSPVVVLQAAEDDIAPAPPSIGADVPVTYFGPAPSNVQKELIGPFQLLKAGVIDQENATITLPLYKGYIKESGEAVWYIVTDSSDKFNADALGINHSPKMVYANVGNGARKATLIVHDGQPVLEFERGTVDFSPDHSIAPGDAPNYFPPKEFQPGAWGDEFYTPMVEISNAGGTIYNAPIVAFGTSAEELNQFCDGDADNSITHDKVVSICPEERVVTLSLTSGFSFSRPVLYLSTDASHPLAATLEGATFAPALADIPTGGDDSLFSAVERIFVATNGQTGVSNPQRQGLNSALSDGGSPLNVLGGIPTIATDYSPLWDINLYEWTSKAIALGYRSRLTEEFDILGKVQQGHLTGVDGGAFGSVRMIVNCPIAFRFL